MEAVRCRYHHNNDHAGVLNICMLVAMLETILFVLLIYWVVGEKY
jgi:hypothetical protein